MKQANRQLAVQMSAYQAMAETNQYRPTLASQLSTMMSGTAAVSQPLAESSASAMAASQGPSMPLIPVLPQWHQAAIMNQSSQDAAKKRGNSSCKIVQIRGRTLGVMQPHNRRLEAKILGANASLYVWILCAAKRGHPKGLCPTRCMGCKQNGSEQDSSFKTCRAVAA